MFAFSYPIQNSKRLLINSSLLESGDDAFKDAVFKDFDVHLSYLLLFLHIV